MSSPLPPAQPAVESPVRGRRPRWGWRVAGLIGAVFLITVLVACLIDADAPDISDLALETIQVPDEENFYLLLSRRGRELATQPIIPSDVEDESDSPNDSAQKAREGFLGSGYGDAETLRERLMRGAAWTPARLQRWGDALDAFARECDTLAKIEKSQGTVPEFASGNYRAGNHREFAYHLRLAVWASYFSGRQEDAVASALTGLTLGRKLANSRGTLVDYLDGNGIHQMFCGALQQLAARPETTSQSLKLINAGLSQAGNGADDYVHSLRNEAVMIHDFLKNLTAEKAASAGLRGTDQIRASAILRVVFPLVYKPNKTAATYVDVMRYEIEVHDRPLSMRSSPVDFAAEWRGVWEFLRPWNLQGRMLMRVILPSIHMVSRARHISFSRQSATHAFVALRLYHQDHGRLPKNLDELVPGYLNAVPVDYVDRQTIRYSSDSLAVWSVGANNLDIRSANQEISSRDIAYRLDFAAPAEAKTAPSEDSDQPQASP